MIKSGKIIDSENKALIGVIIAESDNLGNFKVPITQIIESDENGNFKGNFKNNTFYTASFVGTKKFTFNTKDGVPASIKLLDDLNIPEIVITAPATDPKKNTYYWLIPIGLLLLLLLKKRKKNG